VAELNGASLAPDHTGTHTEAKETGGS
jgi:hypothetical protein